MKEKKNLKKYVFFSFFQHVGTSWLATSGTRRAGHLVLDLRIAHDRFGSSSDPSINGHLHYPNDVDRSLNEVVDKIRKYRANYNINPPNSISFMTTITSTSGGYIVNLCDFYSYKLIGKLTVFL